MKENLWNVAPFFHKMSMKFAEKRKNDVTSWVCLILTKYVS